MNGTTLKSKVNDYKLKIKPTKKNGHDYEYFHNMEACTVQGTCFASYVLWNKWSTVDGKVGHFFLFFIFSITFNTSGRNIKLQS